AARQRRSGSAARRDHRRGARHGVVRPWIARRRALRRPRRARRAGQEGRSPPGGVRHGAPLRRRERRVPASPGMKRALVAALAALVTLLSTAVASARPIRLWHSYRDDEL